MIIADFPLVTVAIRTCNSSKVLEKTLQAIRNQSYPQDKIDLLVVDGMSKDNTKEIANKYNCRIIDNFKIDLNPALLLCLENTKGKYLLSVDHDEVLENPDSIRNRIETLNQYPECKLACLSGYKKPVDYPLLNQYLSDFGDPFSLFVYNCPKDYNFFYKYMMRHSNIEYNDDDKIIVTITSPESILMEVCCGGNIIDYEYFLKLYNGNFSDLISDGQAFYRMVESGQNKIIITKNDPLVHYSVDSFKVYYAKLKWRIINNVHFPERQAVGFTGRIKYQKKLLHKKYLFLPYVFTIIGPTIQGIIFSISRKNTIYFLHLWLCLYVACNICYQYFLKIIGKKPVLKTYDGKKTLERF